MNTVKGLKTMGTRRVSMAAVKGFLMAEAMVAVAVFSVALVGLISLQSLSAKHSVEAEDRLTASVLANDIVAIMWVQGPGNSADDITAWEAEVARKLPSGEGEVVIDGDTVLVQLEWTPVWSQEGDQQRQYSTRVAVF